MIAMLPAGTRAALYARVSTKEGKQHLENQLRELRDFAGRQGWKIEATYTDEITGDSARRPGLDKLFREASSVDVVLIYDLSRLTRGGVASAFENVGRLKAAGVDLWSLRDEFCRTPGPLGQLLLAIAAWVAQMEKETIQNRVKAGQARARAAGVRIGRPKALVDRSRVVELRSAGESIRGIARILNCGKAAIERTLAELENPAA